MMPALDLRTMVLIYVGIRLGLALALVYLWRIQRHYPPAKDWALGALLSAAGLFLLALRELAPVWMTEILSNALLLPGWMIFDYGIAKAAGKNVPYKSGLVLCALAVTGVAWYCYGAPSYPARVLVHNATLITFDLYAAYACLTASKASRTLTFRLIALLLIILSITCLWRVLAGTFAFPTTMPASLPRLLWVVVAIIIFPMLTLLLALLTSQRLQDELNEQARRDALTGAFNRRAFDEIIGREWARTLRHGDPLSVLAVDIDHFKRINDQYGHQTGDATLVHISNTARTTLRTSDTWCRYGGEEFVAVLPNTGIEDALTVAERLRSAVEETIIATPSGTTTVSVSIGVAERTSTQTEWAQVFALADAALYQAKAAGRNQVRAPDSSASP